MRRYSEKMDRLVGSVIREIFKMMADPQIISLAGGSPAKESFPVETIREIADKLIAENPVQMLQYGVTCGHMPLREAYIEHMLKPKGIQAEVKNVLTCTGSGQGIYLICDVFVDKGDAILVESPTFLSTLNVLNKIGARLIPVSTDENGLIVEDLEAKIKQYNPKMLYTIPTFQNPSGRTIPAARRRRIAELSAEYNMIVLEDDPYGELRFRGEAVPPIKSFDAAGNVILLNSFSKIIAPGIRVGAMCAADDIIQKIELVKQGADTHTPTLTQAICAEYLNRGLLPAHLDEVADIYRVRLDAMLDGMAKHFPAGCKYTKPEGGLFVWTELPGDIDCSELNKKAIEKHKVAFVPGSPFCVDPADGKHCLRLNFSSSNAEQISLAIERLGGLIQSEL
ncbi:MAG: PLP-dependent aminotransferase family protein [Bacillota bacterium]|nr:PLP-dependent aminotransferase family protein [Bacillota bacterium]